MNSMQPSPIVALSIVRRVTVALGKPVTPKFISSVTSALDLLGLLNVSVTTTGLVIYSSKPIFVKT